MNILQLIEFYKTENLNVIPLIHRTKTPEKGFELSHFFKEKYPIENIEQKLKQEIINLGIICGQTSENLLVVDFDKEKICDKIFGPDIDKNTFAVKTSKGKHVYFKTDWATSSFSLRELGIDVKAQGGYVVTAPSVHPSGATYTVEQLTPIKKWSGDFKEDFFELLAARGFKFTRETTEVNVNVLQKGVSEGARDEAAVRLATWYRVKNFKEEDALKELLRWNKLNKPPLPESQIEKCVKSAYKKTEPYNFKFVSKYEVPQELRAEAEKLLEDPKLLSYITDALKDIVREYENKLCLAILILAKQSVEVTGASAAGKNTLVDNVLKLFPDDWCEKITGVTDKALRYLSSSIRTLYLAERGAFERKGEETTAAFDIKLTISEGKLKIIVADPRAPEGYRKIESTIENIVTTTTELNVPGELLNRIFQMSVDESVEQNQLVRDFLLQECAKKPSERIDVSREKEIVKAVMKIVDEEAPKEFVIPYAPLLTPMLNASEARVRRDTLKLLLFLGAVAKLHYRQRVVLADKNNNKYVVVAPEDFWYAWRIGKNTFLETFTGMPSRLKKVLDACIEIVKAGEYITSRSLSQVLGCTDRTAMKYLEALRNTGAVTLSEEKKGRLNIYVLSIGPVGPVGPQPKAISLQTDLETEYQNYLRHEKVTRIPEIKIFCPVEKFFISGKKRTDSFLTMQQAPFQERASTKLPRAPDRFGPIGPIRRNSKWLEGENHES